MEEDEGKRHTGQTKCLGQHRCHMTNTRTPKAESWRDLLEQISDIRHQHPWGQNPDLMYDISITSTRMYTHGASVLPGDTRNRGFRRNLHTCINSPLRVNPVKKIPISKSPSKPATPVETPANPQLSSTGFASFDRDFSNGELLDRDRSNTSI